VKEQTKILGEITARLKHTEQILHASEDKYRTLVENADCIILRMNTDGNITFFNEFAQRFFGYTEREILGKNLAGTILPKADKSDRNFFKIAKAVQRSPERYSTYEKESICKDGRRVWIVWANKAIRDKKKNITEILCVGHDITHRKQMENELRLLAAVVRNSNDAITVQDLKAISSPGTSEPNACMDSAKPRP
jgi:PAS domain S-box-containing protein